MSEYKSGGDTVRLHACFRLSFLVLVIVWCLELGALLDGARICVFLNLQLFYAPYFYHTPYLQINRQKYSNAVTCGGLSSVILFTNSFSTYLDFIITAFFFSCMCHVSLCCSSRGVKRTKNNNQHFKLQLKLCIIYANPLPLSLSRSLFIFHQILLLKYTTLYYPRRLLLHKLIN